MDGTEDERRSLKLDYFLALHGWRDAERRPIAGDASFRRYLRLNRDSDSVIVMDAPPPREDVRPFMAASHFLADRGLSAPTILAADEDGGFLLLEDLGERTFSRMLLDEPDAEARLYEAAVDCLVELHKADPPSLPSEKEDHGAAWPPDYDMDLLLSEAALFADWYLPALRGGPLGAGERQAFLDLWRDALGAVAGARDVLVLRDYHADNLMWLADREGVAQVGLLDYQDAVRGHAAYDLVSLLEDARRDVPPELARSMIDRYLGARPDLDADAFQAAYAVLGAQRNTKIIGIFTRLLARDGKPVYLDLVPRVWGLLERDLAHPALAPLRRWFDENVPAEARALSLAKESVWHLPKHAMVLAAGLGTRMRPLTDKTPKPLIPVGGTPMLDRTLDRLAAAGVSECVVNIHHLPDLMRAHRSARAQALPHVTLSDETGELLDSGGGVKKALGNLGQAAFFTLNSDTVWDNGAGTDCLLRLAAMWDPTRMDALLLVIENDRAIGHAGKGDFFLDEAGRLSRRGTSESAPYTFIGIQILSHAVFSDTPDGPFSLNLIYDRALREGRLFGLVHEGRWFHVGTPDALREANSILAAPEMAGA